MVIPLVAECILLQKVSKNCTCHPTKTRREEHTSAVDDMSALGLECSILLLCVGHGFWFVRDQDRNALSMESSRFLVLGWWQGDGNSREANQWSVKGACRRGARLAGLRMQPKQTRPPQSRAKDGGVERVESMEGLLWLVLLRLLRLPSGCPSKTSTSVAGN